VAELLNKVARLERAAQLEVAIKIPKMRRGFIPALRISHAILRGHKRLIQSQQAKVVRGQKHRGISCKRTQAFIHQAFSSLSRLLVCRWLGPETSWTKSGLEPLSGEGGESLRNWM